MTAANSLRKGWCPGALRPMQAKDGLLVRLKPSCGVLRAAQARDLADCGRRYGNGLLELTSRGNLQIRGVRPDTLTVLQARLDDLGFLDPNPEAEAIRNILISPMHCLSRRVDIAILAKALEGELRNNHALHALPAKFSFLIDDGSLPSLHDISADLRFRLLQQPDIFSVRIGGTGSTGYFLGDCKAAELVVTASEIAQRFLRLMSQHGVTKIGELIPLLGASPVARAFGFSDSSFEAAVQKIDMVPIGMLRIEDQNVLGLGLPFGRFTSFMLEEVANISASIGSGEIRLTPFRAILIPAVKTNISTACLTDLAGKGFIVEPHNPRLKIAACGGESACEQASTSTQPDGLALAEMLAPLHSNQLHIHISGCTKGCAHSEPAPLTLVANAGLYDVILNGTAADSPIAEGLNLTEIKSFLKQQLEHGALHGR